MDLNIPNHFNESEENMETFLENITYYNSQNLEIHKWKRRASKNDEDVSNKCLKILDMGPTSTRKHGMEIW